MFSVDVRCFKTDVGSVYTTNDGKKSPNPEEVISRSTSVFVAGWKFNETVLQSENSVNDSGNNPRNSVTDNLKTITAVALTKTWSKRSTKNLYLRRIRVRLTSL
ncbi:hypothetical protein DPMN_145916 [Dreissena polymorpha]|uniref:Uncharacterized protein n=1 Tax=Dreissena polymorpha TaxID=45954 RepID=A0A9D4F9E8_DREPO|nr:hypothetical protein DPMN_145916 [Dreissena polymorpha]